MTCREEIPPGTEFGKLVVIGEADYHITPSLRKLRKLRCRCTCEGGTVVEVLLHNLRSGATQSCGCYRSNR